MSSKFIFKFKIFYLKIKDRQTVNSLAVFRVAGTGLEPVTFGL